MAFTVRQLIGTNKEVITVLNTDPVKKAQGIMVEHQFSQLPVIDEDRKALGLITSDSILRALNTFGVSIDKLRVLDAMDEIGRTFRDEDDLFYLLDEVMSSNAVLVVDNERKLIGVVTSYDITEYFRQRAEDMMYAEDIETMLKDFINAYFSRETGEINEGERNEAIAAIMPSNRDDLKKFQKALTQYMQLQGDSEFKLKQDLVEKTFNQHLYRKEASKPFDQLTQNHYIDLFLHESRWEHYSSLFSFDQKKIRTLLDDARKTRNDAAHFRSEEITLEQRERLKICRDWLARHVDTITRAFRTRISQTKDQRITDNIITIEERLTSASAEATVTTEVTTTEIPEKVIKSPIATSTETTEMAEEVLAESISTEISPLEEVLSADDSRYARLAIWLQNQRSNEIPLSFRQIEEIIEDNLPPSARKHRAWWSNSGLHAQAYQWLSVGWSVSIISMTGEKVMFFRSRERIRLYNNFFRTLYDELAPIAQFPLGPNKISNRHWMTLVKVPEKGQPVASLGFSFARKERFRVELYIDTGDREKNKQIFDALNMRKNEILTELDTLSEMLEWERIDDKRASRITLYHDGAISDDPANLSKLKTWAIEAMLRFQPVMEKYVSEVIHDL